MRWRALGQGVVLLLLVIAPGLYGQTATGRSWAELTTGSELEQYLRILQVAGEAPLHQVSLRGWSALERDSILPRIALHPWSAQMAEPAKPRGFSFQVIRPQVQLIENTGWAYGSNDGAIWAGRGITTALSGGFEIRNGPLTVVIDPIVFRAENQAFTLKPVSAPVNPYIDPVSPNIDQPQRFGNAAYQRVDPGQSTIRLDLFGVAVGATSANEIWGPAITSPIILGNNAAGVPRVFFGTSVPVNIGIGRLHARMFLGDEGQSAFSRVTGPASNRLAAGLVAVFEPRGLRGLEFGFGRFFHQTWPVGGLTLSDLTIPLAGFLSHGVDPKSPNGGADNQLFSVYARLVLPPSGLELYGEFGREDHAADFRDLSGEPDHISAYTLGLVKSWARGTDHSTTAIRAEFTNGRVTDLAGGRGEGLFYEHSSIAQGHTIYGQIEGSPTVRGGGGGIIAIDRYSTAGRVTFSFARTDEANETEGGLGTGAVSALTVDVMRFRRGFDLSGQLGLIFDTGAQGIADRTQLRFSLGAKFPLGL